MDKDRQRSVRMSTLTAVMAMLVIYLLSFGPACWIVMRNGFYGGDWVSAIYRPVLWGWEYSPQPVKHWIKVYANVGTNGRLFVAPVGGDLCWYER